MKEIMLQMDIVPSVDVRAMGGLLCKTLSDRKCIDKRMINNVRIYARKRKLELDNAKIEINHKYFDTSFITEYKDTVDDYTKDK